MHRERFAAVGLLCATITVAACATPATEQQVTKTTAAFNDLASARLGTFFELKDARGLSGKALEREEQQAYAAFAPVCDKGYANGLTRGISLATAEYRATGSRRRAYELPAFARNLGAQFSDCLNSFGAKGKPLMTLRDGTHLEVPEYMERLLAAAAAKGAAEGQAQIERKQSAAIVAVLALGVGAAAAAGGGVNPEQTSVGSYVRSDGTLVRGHWRTMPNSSCWDNLSGC
ncbi:hypothetical protein [Ollibium composti]|uniref:Lipoprotein n=1 Tax=Ollibium composti TaxID=2675109 RepID=A0ABY2QAL2_9HYPH|nr:hypothetical protein [Mesorhizobium composti]THF58718.1 hypothetical protein E6C48_03405 [Mesorhizobium composti]